MPVVVVTDSSARLPEELRVQWGIRQVPLHILLDGADLRDGVDDIPDNIHEYGDATTADNAVSTSSVHTGPRRPTETASPVITVPDNSAETSITRVRS